MAEAYPQNTDAFKDRVSLEYEKVMSQLNEINVLIHQNEAEVQRQASNNAQSLQYVRQLDIETAPREDIRDGYENLINVQQRLFTMRGQLEKLQADKRSLEEMEALLTAVLRMTGQGDLIQAETDVSSKPVDQSGIVRVIQSEEFTRQSLVRQMHDGPASSLSNFILQAEICERLFDSDPERARQELHVLKEDASATFSKVKDFIFDLRPMMLDDLGVVPTLRSYANSFQDKTGIPLSMSLTGIERRLEGHIEVTVFRAVQELVNNARMHGQATDIQFQLGIDSDNISATVEDNGQGFNIDQVFNGERKTLGLPALKERLEMLGGYIDIQSRMGQGTRAEISIPVTDPMPA